YHFLDPLALFIRSGYSGHQADARSVGPPPVVVAGITDSWLILPVSTDGERCRELWPSGRLVNRRTTTGLRRHGHVTIDSRNEVSADDLKPGQFLRLSGWMLPQMDVVVSARGGIAEDLVSLSDPGKGRLEALKLVARHSVPQVIESSRERNDGLTICSIDLRRDR